MVKELEKEFINISKRILKTNLPHPDTTTENFRQLIIIYNKILAKCQRTIEIAPETPEGTFAQNLFKTCRKKLVKVCLKVNILLHIPPNIEGRVNFNILKDPNESYTTPTGSDSEYFETESEKSDHNSEDFRYDPKLFFRAASPFLTRTPSPISQHNTPPFTPPLIRMAANYEYIRFVNSTLSEFDGTYNNFPRFRNQLNIVRAATDAEDLALGLTLVRAKITNETILARVEQAATMQALLQTIQDSITRPDPQIIIDKIRATKQNINPLKLAEEFTTLASELTKAYVSQDIGIDNANRLVTNVLKDTLATSATNSIVRNAMITNQYTTVDSILEVLIRTENKHSQSFVGAVFNRNNRQRLYQNDSRNFRNFRRGNYRRNTRGNYRNNFRGGYRGNNRNNFKSAYRGNNTNNFNRGNYTSRGRNAKRVYFMEHSPPYPMIEGPSQGN